MISMPIVLCSFRSILTRLYLRIVSMWYAGQPRQLTNRYAVGPGSHDRALIRMEAKARQASKLAEIHEALIAAGCDTTARQAAVLGVCRSTAWVLLNRDKRVGPSANVIKRILSSPKLPPAARRRVEEFVEEKIDGLYGHNKTATRRFRDQLRTSIQPTTKRMQNNLRPAGP